MANKKVENKKIDIKNYIISVLILAVGIAFVLYIFSWYQVKTEEKLMNSYLISTKTVNSVINDLDSYSQIIGEAPNDYFIFIGYTKDENEYNIEKELKDIIDDYKLNDLFYYIDITNIKDNYLPKLNSTLGVELTNTPSLIYVRNGKIDADNIIVAKNDRLDTNEFKKLLEIYEYKRAN